MHWVSGCCRPSASSFPTAPETRGCLAVQEVEGRTGRRRSWHRISTALFVVAETKDVIFGLPLLQHTLQTESRNTWKSPGWKPNTRTLTQARRALHASSTLRNLTQFLRPSVQSVERLRLNAGWLLCSRSA